MRKLTLLAAVLVPASVGAQWTFVAGVTTAELRGLSMVDDTVVWASGSHGTVLRSMDGGRTWLADSVPGAGLLDLRAIHAFNDGAAIVVSSGEADKGLARIYSTTDGGRHWSQVYATEQKGAFFDAVGFWDRRSGVVLSDPVDGRFLILTTSDKGSTWTPIEANRLPAILTGEAAFAASGSSLVLRGDSAVWIGTGGGGPARVMRSTDRGHTWSVADVPVHATGAAAGIFSLSFTGGLGIAVGGDYTEPRLASQSVALSTDGGRTWRPAKSPPAAYLSGVALHPGGRTAIAVGLAGTFLSRDGGDSWTQTDTIPLNAVRIGRRTAVAVGPRGRVAWMDIAP